MKQEVLDLIKQKNVDINDWDDAHELYEALDYDGSLHELIDSSIDIYYYDLRKWSVENYSYIEDAIEEGLCEGVSDFHKLIQVGQYMYYSEQMREVIEEVFNEGSK